VAPTSPDGGIVQTRMTDELMPMQTRDGFDLQLLVEAKSHSDRYLDFPSCTLPARCRKEHGVDRRPGKRWCEYETRKEARGERSPPHFSIPILLPLDRSTLSVPCTSAAVTQRVETGKVSWCEMHSSCRIVFL